MSGLVGKGVRSYKKAIVSDSNFPALGFRNFIMAFQADAMGVGAGVGVDLTSALIVPPEMVAAGFEQPDPIEIGNAQLGNFRNNVIVTSNLNGILIDRVSYTLTNDSITFDDGLNANEIIVIKRGNEAVTGNRIVDARPLRASGTVNFSMIGSSPVIFEVGEGFRIAPSTTSTGGIDNRQIGFVQVFVDGVLQSRNVGNEDEASTPAAMQTGNYREVIVNTATNLPLAVQNGVTANAIQFNQFQPFSSMEGVIVISTNLIVDAPNSTGVLDQIDVVQAQVTSNDVDIAANTAAIAGFGSGHIIENDAGADLAERANLQFIDSNVFDNPGNDRTIITPHRAHRGTSQLQNVLRRPVGNAINSANGVQETFSWTCPADIVEIYLELVGAGASGVGAPSQGESGAGGGSGAYYQGWHTVVPGNTYVVRTGTGGGETGGSSGTGQRTGANSDFSGNIDGSPAASIIAGGSQGQAGGNFGISGFTVGDVPQLLGPDTLGNNPHFTPPVAPWNSDVWRTAGGAGASGAGGSNYRVTGAPGNQGGGGGSGYSIGVTPSPSGNSGGGGSGGIRISWYSNISNGTTNPVT